MGAVPYLARLGTVPLSALGQAGCHDHARHLFLLQHFGGVQAVSGFSLWLFFILVFLLHTLLPSPAGKEKTAAMVTVGFPSKGHRRRALAARALELLA